MKHSIRVSDQDNETNSCSRLSIISNFVYSEIIELTPRKYHSGLVIIIIISQVIFQR